MDAADVVDAGVVAARLRRQRLRLLMLGFGFRVSSFRLRVSSFRFQVSSSRLRDYGFEFQVSGCGIMVSSFGFQVGAGVVSACLLVLRRQRLRLLACRVWGYRGTSLTRKRTHLGPYLRHVPRVPGGS